MFKNPNGGIGWPPGYSLRGGVDLGTISASGRKKGVVYPVVNKYHLIARGLFSNLKASFI